jgi:hypothetical protein
VSSVASAKEEAAVVDAVAEQATANKTQQGELSPEEQKKQEEVTKLIENKKYFVPIGQVAKRRNKRASLAILVLLVLLVGFYLAVDAGIIMTTISLPVDLIK